MILLPDSTQKSAGIIVSICCFCFGTSFSCKVSVKVPETLESEDLSKFNKKPYDCFGAFWFIKVCNEAALSLRLLFTIICIILFIY